MTKREQKKDVWVPVPPTVGNLVDAHIDGKRISNMKVIATHQGMPVVMLPDGRKAALNKSCLVTKLRKV